MTVVSDTSPLNYPILVGSVELLKALFGTIAVPAAVISELQSEHAPDEIREWLAHKPDWIEVHPFEIPKDFLPLGRRFGGRDSARRMNRQADPRCIGNSVWYYKPRVPPQRQLEALATRYLLLQPRRPAVARP